MHINIFTDYSLADILKENTYIQAPCSESHLVYWNNQCTSQISGSNLNQLRQMDYLNQLLPVSAYSTLACSTVHKPSLMGDTIN